MKSQFNDISGRDREAKAYFSSEDFYQTLKDKVQEELVKWGCKKAELVGGVKVAAKPQDMPYIQEAFNRLKKDYPELNHVRLQRGPTAAVADLMTLCLNGYGYIIVDTKKNTFLRRLTCPFIP